ncbi:MAG: HAD-IB family hydrolase [Deltaproteobacteria bacterium HGW-Deltaproteobacteria-14]|jgi:HAD superfamily hydrolase (TIGR01490 family)|nr:MAG: HAD-IB family hydrolase [Deltaproteobacteria bacterium HGW-Deltaproteobacteria-14]
MPASTHSAPAPRGAAFFDLDGTLVAFNSGMRFARYEYRHGRIGRLNLAQSAVWMALYHLSLVDMTRAFGRAVAYYKGVYEADLDAHTRAWFEAEVAGHLQPGARSAIDEHRSAGRPLVLLSSTSSYQARAALERWGFDDWLANRFPVDAAGRLTGELAPPLCYGAGKVEHAREWAAPRGVDLAESWFYSDSYSDVPMLAAVGHPVVVLPDPRLRRHARKVGWPIVDWR